MAKATTVEEYLEKSRWKAELTALRNIMLQTEMVECIKWGAPAYTVNNKNVIGLAGFKTHFAIWFHNGFFLRDEDKILVNAQEEKTKGMRQWRFTEQTQIDKNLVLKYVQEAIENQKNGLEIKPGQKQVNMPAELAKALENDALLLNCFNALSPGKRKEYAEYIGSAKQEKTRLDRIAKCTEIIKLGLGLNDKYK